MNLLVSGSDFQPQLHTCHNNDRQKLAVLNFDDIFNSSNTYTDIEIRIWLLANFSDIPWREYGVAS
jgi:hypothetical protein